jgi:hypothetical protein
MISILQNTIIIVYSRTNWGCEKMLKKSVLILIAAILASFSIAGADQENKIASEKHIGNFNYTSMVPGTAVFSPDGDHFAYIIKTRGGMTAAVLDGVTGPKYNNISAVRFSPNSQHYAYAAISGKRMMVIIDGKEGPKYDRVGIPVSFSPDSNHSAYPAGLNNSTFMVVDGKGGDRFDNINGFLFGPKGDHFAYIATKGDNQFVVSDSQKGPNFDKVIYLEYNSEGSHLAYIVQDLFFKTQFVVLDGTKGKEYDVVTLINNSLFDSKGNLRYISVKGPDIYRVETSLA